MIQKLGHTYQFEVGINLAFKRPVVLSASPILKGQADETEAGENSKLFATRLREDHEDIEDVLCDNEELPSPES
jgi:hypothetical protein